jgi:diguanylate cyclase (GGDEF)-like protein
MTDKTIVSVDVQQALLNRRLWRLRFPPPIEARYAEFFDWRFRIWYRVVPIAALIGQIARLAFVPIVTVQSLRPLATLGPISVPSLAVHLTLSLLVLLLTIATGVAVYTNVRTFRIQVIASVGAYLFTLLIIITGVLRVNQNYLDSASLPIVVLALVFGYRVRFWLACLFGGAVIVTQILAILVSDFSTPTMITTVFLTASYVLLSLLGSYLLEYETRADFLGQLALENERSALAAANRRLSSYATIDSLTGVANRRVFDEFLETEWRRAKRMQSPVSLIMLDLDHFKALNDRAGHQQGDLSLAQVAARLRTFARRPTDLVARYGGEEFAMVLGGVDDHDAHDIAERIRQSIADLQIPNPGASSGVLTISAGVATIIPTDRETTETLLGAADRALYRAKQQGRNQVVGQLVAGGLAGAGEGV